MAFPRAGVVLIGLGGAGTIVLAGWTGVRAVGVDVLHAGWAIPICIALYALQLLLSATAWRQASGCVQPPIGTWFRIRWVRESVNALLPVAQVGGGVVGVRMLSKNGLPTPLIAASTTLDITLESVSQFLFSLAGVFALMLISPAAWRPWLGGAVGVMALASGGFVLAQRVGLMRLLEALSRQMGRMMPGLPPDMLGGLHAELMRLHREPAALGAAVALHLVAWTVGVAETWFALLAMGYRTSALAALVIESVGMAARSAGFAIPASLGAQEGGFVLAFGLLGMAPDAAVALSMVKRARDLLAGIPGLLVWQWWEGRRLWGRSAITRLRLGWRGLGEASRLIGQQDPS